ncbi:MAG TPA: hypothetical protein VFV42_13030 [Acidimicrobiales bacterium]|nr:hypothetical protein [Acidimicrobiales bacterium]
MTVATALTNLAMSLVYLCYGTITLFDLKDNWHDRTRRQFGLAFLAIMFTCGPHHADHGLHLLLTDVEAGAYDLFVVALGLPAGVVWFGLRMEALLGGTGDRHVSSTPRLLTLLPVLGVVYLVGTVAGVAGLMAPHDLPLRAAPNLVVMVLYFFVGATLTATQFRNHEASGRWSVSGLALASIFYTCALMHLVYAAYTTTGQYVDDGHVLAIDVLAVPGAAYFLWLVVAVHRGQIGRSVQQPAPAVAA